MATASRKDDYITTKYLGAFGDNLRKDIVDDISKVITEFGQQVDERFNIVEFKLEKTESQFGKIEERMAKLEEGQSRLLNTLDAFLKRLDDIEKDNIARDAHIARLERRLEQLEQKAGL